MSGKAFRIDFDPSDLQAELDKIEAKAAECVRPAAQAGAEVLYDEARLRAPVSEKVHTFYGTHQKYQFAPGTLRNSIYQVYSQDNSDDKKATYHIAWNHRKAPYGFMVEYGTSRAPAHPFLRPAYEAKKNVSLAAARDVFVSMMEGALPELRK